jgi:hypothetical protein
VTNKETKDMSAQLLHQLKQFDARRPGFPGEHWLAFAAGLGLWLATRRHPSVPLRIVAGVAGGLLVAHAASGRKVPHLMRKWMPYASR